MRRGKVVDDWVVRGSEVKTMLGLVAGGLGAVTCARVLVPLGPRHGCAVRGALVLRARGTVQWREGNGGCRKHGGASGSYMRRG